MSRFIKIQSSVINLDEIRQAHLTDHATDPTLVIDLGGKPLELSGSAAHAVWQKLLMSLQPEDWTPHHSA